MNVAEELRSYSNDFAEIWTAIQISIFILKKHFFQYSISMLLPLVGIKNVQFLVQRLKQKKNVLVFYLLFGYRQKSFETKII